MNSPNVVQLSPRLKAPPALALPESQNSPEGGIEMANLSFAFSNTSMVFQTSTTAASFQAELHI